MQQLLYRSATFDDGYSEKHNSAVRVKLISSLMESEVGQVLFFSIFIRDYDNSELLITSFSLVTTTVTTVNSLSSPRVSLELS